MNGIGMNSFFAYGKPRSFASQNTNAQVGQATPRFGNNWNDGNDESGETPSWGSGKDQVDLPQKPVQPTKKKWLPIPLAKFKRPGAPKFNKPNLANLPFPSVPDALGKVFEGGVKATQLGAAVGLFTLGAWGGVSFHNSQGVAKQGGQLLGEQIDRMDKLMENPASEVFLQVCDRKVPRQPVDDFNDRCNVVLNQEREELVEDQQNAEGVASRDGLLKFGVPGAFTLASALTLRKALKGGKSSEDDNS